MDPKIFRKRLLDWYTLHRRRLPWRETSAPYAIWVSEVMLQQTQVATAIPYYQRFMDRFPTPVDLAAADLEAVLKGWEGLGYYSRARNLHRAAGIVAAGFDGKVPDDPLRFRALPGVGEYICAAVMSIAFGRVLAVVDGNVKRVLARMLEIDTPVNQASAHKVFMVPATRLICPKQPADFNQAIMELGALICRPKSPDCDACPLSTLCQAKRHHTVATFPKRVASKKIPHRHLTIGVVLKKGKMLAVQRAMDGLLGGLWEFPAAPKDAGSRDDHAMVAMIKTETGLTVTVDRLLTSIRHAYTHFTLSGDVYLCRHVVGRVRLKNAPAHRWVTLRSLKRLPLHKAVHKIMVPLAEALGSGK